jgi:Domain of unknown function (DUF4954)/Domain of unknown function (DUF6819)
VNRIKKNPLDKLGYGFIEPQYLPKGKDEYYLRNQQNVNREYRQLTAHEIETLVRNNNTSDNWNNFLVEDAFDADLVKNCQFHGLIRIGKLEPYYLEFHNLRLSVGLYNSIIASCDFGDNVSIHNVDYLSHYIIGNEVMIVNVNEMAATDYARFGNGILKEGEPEQNRTWLELCNENGGRSILPFEGMLPGDAYLWTRFREDEMLMQKFKTFTEQQFDSKRGYYGIVGDRSVIKNCKIIKDTHIGSDAYLKGANKIKNLTINSNAEAKSQIGEGCELVNGIIGFGCRIFYGVKAVRFVMASHSSLKYGARLINSYLGNNATVSCCEVLNSLIFPAHEQHHNNSFLCAAMIMGQSNMAAGATIGSNHNSRGADGEIIAGRGFWPGLCVSLKHNSRFASFTLIAKGSYPAEIDLKIPFSLLVHEESENYLKVMPGYWFLYNMYALARNSWKYEDRDKRTDKIQLIEYDYLAPDSIEEMFMGLRMMEIAAGKAYTKKQNIKANSEEEYAVIGKKLLLTQPDEVARLTLILDDIENSSRQNILIKAHKAYPVFKNMIILYGIECLLQFILEERITEWKKLQPHFTKARRTAWCNVGGQLMPAEELTIILGDIKKGSIQTWDALHDQYRETGKKYSYQKLQHAIASLMEIKEITTAAFTTEKFKEILQESVAVREWITKNIYKSREKDYLNPFRKMVYDNEEQMQAVIGNLSDNSFIKQTNEQLNTYKKQVQEVINNLH